MRSKSHTASRPKNIYHPAKSGLAYSHLENGWLIGHPVKYAAAVLGFKPIFSAAHTQIGDCALRGWWYDLIGGAPRCYSQYLPRALPRQTGLFFGYFKLPTYTTFPSCVREFYAFAHLLTASYNPELTRRPHRCFRGGPSSPADCRIWDRREPSPHQPRWRLFAASHFPFAFSPSSQRST